MIIFPIFLYLTRKLFFWSKPQTNGVNVGPHRAHTTTLVGERLFLFGGGDGPNYFDSLFVLDTKTNTWTQPEVKGPGPRRAHTATLVGSEIYVFGGGDGNKALNEVYILDSEKLTWTKCNTHGALIGPRGYHTAELVADKILVFGGSDGKECFSDIYTLDLRSREWSKRKTVNPFPRLAHTSTLVGPMIFAFGGHDGSDYVQELNVLKLGAQQMEWIKLQTTGDAPSPRGYHASVLHDSRLFVFGGFDGEKCFDELYMLELGTLAYLPLQNLPAL